MPPSISYTARLTDLAATARSAGPSDQEAIAGLGAALEETVCLLAGERPDAVEVLTAALEALQAIFAGQAADGAAAMKAIAQAMDAVGAALADTTGATALPLQEVLAALKKAVAPADTVAAPPETQAPPSDSSIDDAAAMLISLDPNNPADLARLKDTLDSICARQTMPEAALAHMQAAQQAVDRVIRGEAADARAALGEAAQAVAKVCSAKEAEEFGGPPKAKSQPQATESTAVASVGTAAPAVASTAAPVAPQAAPSVGGVAAGPVRFDKPAVLPLDTDQGLLKEYVAESLDHITAAEASLLALETDPEQSEAIHVVFRAFHTIKGASGFLNLDRIQRLAHLAESMLDRVRTGQIKLAGGYADLALEACDQLKFMVQGLTGIEFGTALPIPETLNDLLARLENPEAAGIDDSTTASRANVPRLGDILVAEGKASRDGIESAMASQPDAKVGEAIVGSGAATGADVAKALRLQKQMRGDDSADSAIRVNTQRLDSLVNMIGELVISHSMIAQDPDVASGALARLGRNVTRTGKIVRELQDLSMSLRMVPLKATFQKMARLVRDVAKKSDKQVHFLTEGEDTEIDRSMVESLGDPLIHMIRNAVDHGVESPEKRQAAGKPATGTIRLRAYHSAGNVVLELSDDGKGLDREKILAKAVQQKLVAPGEELSETEIFRLVFLPGFSTAEKVTDISGRGVGMDVVRKSIEGLHGRVVIASKAGQGSTFTVRLPLTMAIADAMVLRVGRERYLLPTVSIVQSFRPERESLSTVTGQGEMVLLRGQLIPVFRLHRMFNISDTIVDPTQGLLIVIEAANTRCALLVDELLGQQQVVIKTLGHALGQVPGIAGGAILGDGRVGLILDAGGVVELARGHQAPVEAAMAN
jgi:two-component system chemotaxis sensor kinase CheA